MHNAYARMHAWQKEKRSHGPSSKKSSLLTRIRSACAACQRASATHRNARSALFHPRPWVAAHPQTLLCGVQPVCCLRRANPCVGAMDAREPGNAEEALEKALCSLVA
jgi:hypothetical protein